MPEFNSTLSVLKTNDHLNESTRSFLESRYDMYEYIPCVEYADGTLLHTLDGRKWTNAAIIEQYDAENFLILTDFGNILRVTKNELAERYYPPTVRRRKEVTCRT